jgi:putative tryptophan/tyrosine transport system substrate-binding protein
VKRREFIRLLVSAAATCPGLAQSQTALPVLAILAPNHPTQESESLRSLRLFFHALGDLGERESQTFRLETRYAEGHLDRFPALAAELVQLHPKLIYTWTSAGAFAAARATSDIPIVVGPAGEDVFVALSKDFGRPTGNVTGVVLESPDTNGKALEVLKEAAPPIWRIGVLINPDNPAWQGFPEVLVPAASALGVSLVGLTSRGTHDLDGTLAQIHKAAIDGLFIVSDSTFADDAFVDGLTAFLRTHRLPSVARNPLFPRKGGLLSLGTDQAALRVRAALYVHRILRGASVRELPVERPTKFNLTFNLRLAKEMGLEPSTSILLRADEVIE